MATINFLYRSTKPEAFLNIRLLFRLNDSDYQIGGKSKIKVSKDYWKNHHGKTRIKDIDIKNQQTEVNNEINNLENYILNAFNNINPEKISKKWLKNEIDFYYNPPEELPQVPKDLISFIDYYLERKQYDITENRKQRVKVVKRKIERLEKSLGQKISVDNVGENFKKEFVEFGNLNQYSNNTQQRDLSTVKTICSYARKMGLETHPELDDLKIKGETVNHVYLNTTEIEKIKNLQLEADYLANARDWLLISCYTGQRVSDFMRFDSEMIRFENERYFLDFKQQKTKKLMSIPFIKEAREILKKRNGKFPRATSHQRYNDYIKEVCELAGLDELTKGKMMTCITPEKDKPTRNDYRRITGTFEKWELVSSHIGRRSFATNHYGKIPTTYLMYITGHGTEKMFLNYIKKSNTDMAADAYDYFN
ncbi:tyrosine-type recombinase/integrase [Mesonia sp.]|uniref:tyrosine-type recombinase/integrase n=1 Tax=Mesonia sp. TaxID=1960830 RepID=UPI003F9D5494